MPDIQSMLAALLNAQAGTGAPIGQRPTRTVTAPQPTPLPEEPQPADNEAAEGPQPSDEEMLENVSNNMGKGPAPPPMSGMEWKDVDADREALLEDPSPENMDAFVQYWGEDEIPPELSQQTNRR